jgi:hypothetical protein
MDVQRLAWPLCLGLSLLLAHGQACFADEAEDQVAAWLVKLGGTVERDRKSAQSPVVSATLPASIDDQAIGRIAVFRHLQVLDLSQTQITNVGLRSLSELRHLRELDLLGTAIGGDGCKVIAGLRELHKLNLAHTSVADGDVDALAKLPQLRELDLSSTNVTNAGLKRLLVNARLGKGLRKLHLAGLSIDDSGLRAIDSFTELQSLQLGDRATDPTVGLLFFGQQRSETSWGASWRPPVGANSYTTLNVGLASIPRVYANQGRQSCIKSD